MLGHENNRNAGFSNCFAYLALPNLARDKLLDIYPRPGHSYIGSAIFGLHMPVWSIIIAAVILLAFAIKFAVLGGDLRDPHPSPTLGRIARLLSLYVITICLINFGSVILQCGTGACHTSGYKLLSG